ncbi:tyrosine--tRNA ligase [Angelakisella massiliensis]|uniref:tyrosine--tRNA ligase n=1 Tax=Angelakisella massiliensis TaxID=1871018 RepID=UPI0024B24A1B|nr:tyrosine--tRNA ligase [Angelakisella massiliensis]
MSKVFEELERRGLIAQMTHPEKIREKLDNEKTTFYIGFDATADSLHVGHFLQLMVINHMIRAGHTPILLLGTGTTMVGDPTGKTDMRKMLSVEEINYNADRFLEQMGRLVPLDKCIVERNGDWLMKLNYIELLRDIGVHFSVNRMLTAECFKSRLERGLSFIEFNYMIMQSYDFLKLYQTHNCTMELGGDDQWSNIIGGVELVRRVEGEEVCGMTFTLLTTKEGKKMGKTESGAVWLDPKKYSPYDFFQYWRNVGDDDVINCLKLITFVPIEEIEEMEKWQGSDLNKAKERLAYEVTKFVHGQEEADKALAAAKALFVSGSHDENMPTTVLAEADFTDGAIGLTDLLVKTGLAPSKAEARRLIQQGGISVDDQKVTDPAAKVERENISGHMIIKKGKKVYHKVTLA